MSPLARYTPSKQSPSTVCFEGVGWECAESLAVTRGVAVATILSASMNTPGHEPSTKSKARLRWAAFGLFLALVAFAVVACATTPAAQSPASSPAAAAATASVGVSASPAVSPSHSATAEPLPLTPAAPVETASLPPETASPPRESRSRVRQAAQNAGSAVGDFARTSYRCFRSLFRNCSGDAND